IRDATVTGVQTCALPIWGQDRHAGRSGQALADDGIDPGLQVDDSQAVLAELSDVGDRSAGEDRQALRILEIEGEDGDRLGGEIRSEERRVGQEVRYRLWA